jgi:hypothetical protein
VKRGVATALLLAVAAAAMACGGGSGDGGNSTTATTTTATTTTTTTGTFAQLRDALRTRLEGIGVNIGSVPDDVLRQILNQCHELDEFADQSRVTDLCDAIRRARDTNDAGLIDQIVTQLGQLKTK